ncbi:cell division ATP-binding protein FtsE [bacterium]|nr:cell division ATP-binding protein FtsE [bacterium]
MIQLFHVFKSYDGENMVLKDINMIVEKGEFVFLTGVSGAGKTTLLKMLFLEEKPSRGQILIHNKNISRLSSNSIPFLRRNIGVVFQDFKLIEYRTVFENIAITLEILDLPRKVINQKVINILKLVGLEHRKNHLPKKLSGGEQQRVAIARALVNDPAILLADEPTGNLDPQITIEIMKLFEKANNNGTTILIATHDSSLMERYKKRVLHIEDGRVF